MDSDIIIVGGGPAGLAFARQFKDSGLRITVIEKAPEESLQNPAYDGREIALTHRSREIMQRLGMWQRIPENEIYRLRDAKVFNGKSDYTLHFAEPKHARGGPTDRLGNLISNHNIRRAAYEEAVSLPNVSLRCGVGVKSVRTDREAATVELENGETLHARLLVAADSRLSQTRRQLGISADMHDFGRTVIVFRTKHTVSNEHTACECFFYGRTLALLPLEEHMTNCVVTIQNTRAALIGDAAVGMHPVTAHGYNLGLESTDILAKLILKAEKKGRDIGSHKLLEKYNIEHQLHTRPLYHGTNAMVNFFTTETRPVKALRGAVLRISNNLPPLKKLISRQLTG